MYTPETSTHFQRYQDPVSGVETYILKDEIAPVTQSFYFVNPSMTRDGRYLWFYCAFPPAGSAENGRTLGLLDFEADAMYHFPETQFTDASPWVDPGTGEVYWCNLKGIYMRRPAKEAQAAMVARSPFGKKPTYNIATHLSRNADHTELFLDGDLGDSWQMGSLDMATGTYTEWYHRDYCCNHAQFHPRDRDLVLFAEDEWTDRLTGSFHGIRRRQSDGRYLRLWTIRRGEEPRSCPVYENRGATHEWWSGQGDKIYYCSTCGQRNVGICSYNIHTGESLEEVPAPAWHGHSSREDAYFVMDENDGFWRGCPSRTSFYHKGTGKRVYIISENPALVSQEDSWEYHTDPHPQFTGGDKYIAHTTTVLGKVCLALTPLQQLVEMTG